MKREDIDKVLAELKELQCKTQKEVEEARVRFLGKKGEITALFEEFRTVDKELKREFGRTLNELKNAAEERIKNLRETVGEETTRHSSAEKESSSPHVICASVFIVRPRKTSHCVWKTPTRLTH